jgi:hypothetical protein
MAAPSTYVTLIKDMTYRGLKEEWSNSYALTGTTPADTTAWRALFDAMCNIDKAVMGTDGRIIGGYGYNRIPQTGDHAIYSIDLLVSPNSPVVGTAVSTGGYQFSGDGAAWVRWGLDRFNTNGKRVYLRKYLHAGYINSSGGPDALLPAYKTALLLYATKYDDGSLLGSRKVCDKDGNVPIGHAVSDYVTTRTLKRRGKRPPT